MPATVLEGIDALRGDITVPTVSAPASKENAVVNAMRLHVAPLVCTLHAPEPVAEFKLAVPDPNACQVVTLVPDLSAGDRTKEHTGDDLAGRCSCISHRKPGHAPARSH